MASPQTWRPTAAEISPLGSGAWNSEIWFGQSQPPPDPGASTGVPLLPLPASGGSTCSPLLGGHGHQIRANPKDRHFHPEILN